MSAQKRESVGSLGLLGNPGAPGGEEKVVPEKQVLAELEESGWGER